MKSLRNLDRIDGIAIDNPSTYAHHQLVSFSPSTIHYTVFYAPYNSDPHCELPDGFIQKLLGQTTQDLNEKAALSRCYTQFLTTIRPHGVKKGFELHEVAKALTFDLPYDDRYNPIGFSYRPTLGRMIRKMSYQDAGKELGQNRQFRLLQRFVKEGPTKNNDKVILSFEEVVSRIGKLIGTQKLADDIFEDVDCVFRLNKESYHKNLEEVDEAKNLTIEEWSERYAKRYMSIAEYKTSKQNRLPKDAVIPTTASRTDMDHFNIMTSFEEKITGSNPFPKGTAAAVANYKKHYITWQRLGLV